MSTIHRSSVVRGIATLAGWATSILRVGVLYAFPVAVGLGQVVAILTLPEHRAGIYVLLGGLLLAGVTVTWAGLTRRPRPPRHRRRLSSVQAINRRAAKILVPAALGLATLMGIAATRPAGLWFLAFGVVAYGLPAWIGFEVARVVVRTWQRVLADRAAR
ncbi:MAG TPA: hypothetical protein VEO01_22905 [Pseudonocardiaceae bacterium]|nr:hypothetical protein [Pseudonocardiaceae bacterium]